ncbi:MAG: oligosaccharide flippase family protein [Methylotenera sp.]|nr:oligosaccharide flippase family protein [Methylotenera sp.]
MSLRKNILANYVGTGFVVLAPMLALPYYLHALGSSVWGLVSFITTLQALLSLFDAGISQALVREFAVGKTQNQQKQYKLGVVLFGFERIYWIFAILVGVIVLLASHQITHYWLKLDNLNVDQAQIAVFGAVALFAFQFPGSVYRSLLVGTQAQVLLNIIMTAGALIRHLGGVLVVLTWPTLSAYLIWQVCSVALETMVRGFFAWRTLHVKRSESYWDKSLMQGMLLPIIGMSGATLLGALTVQMDKIILSGMVSIEKFGYYVIASTLATGVLQLLYPIVNAATPHAVNLRHDAQALRKFNFKYAKIVTTIILIAGLIYYIVGFDFLSWWLKSPDIAKQVNALLSVLLIGTALNALYTIGYINWIVKGQFSKILQVNLISLVVSIISIPIMVAKFGMVGASLGWIAMNAVGFFFSLGWLASSKTAINDNVK